MKCPNCGKEAINVNGTYVCLDCGVELNPKAADAPQTAAERESAITNHGPLGGSVNAPDQNDAAPDMPPAVPTPTSAPAEPAPVETPVKDEYLSQLKEEKENTGGSYDFTSTDNAALNKSAADETPTPVPAPTPYSANEPPASAPEAPVEAAGNTSNPANYFNPGEVDITPKDGVSTPPETPPVPEPSPDAPSEPQSEPAPATELFANQTPQFAEPPKEEPSPEPAPTPAFTPSPEENTASEPQNAPTDADLDALLEKYSNAPATVTPTSAPPAPEPASSFPPSPAPSFDTVSSTPSVPQPPITEPPAPPTEEAAPQPAMPGAGNIPSPESVFGPENAGQPETLKVDTPPKKGKKKIVFLVVGVLLAILLLAGGVYLAMSLFSPVKTESPEQTIQDTTFNISEEVSKVMDVPLNVKGTFNQTLDFSNAIASENVSNTASLNTLFSSPLVFSGFWETDEEGNINLDAKFGSTTVKKTYLEAEKSSYVYQTKTKAWNVVKGDQINEVPAFYTPKVKAALFYNTKVNSITEMGEESLNGVNYRKVQIVPKNDVIESVLSGSSTALKDIKFDTVNTDNLTVYAWLTEESKIYKIAVLGDVGVESDLFSGTVAIDSSVVYEYDTAKIQKPKK